MADPLTSSPFPSRRDVLRTAAATLGATAFVAGIPITLAQGVSGKPLIIILLQGGLDGLALTPPVQDPDYREMRGRLALSPPGRKGGIIDLDDDIGLHPAAAELVRFWRAGQLRIAPAVATSYRGEDATVAQAMLQGGLDEPSLAPNSGWLYRAIQAAAPATPPGAAIAVGGPLPLILKGESDVGSVWESPDLPRKRPGFFSKAATLYTADPALNEALTTGLTARGASLVALSEQDQTIRESGQSPHGFPAIAWRLADAMRTENGPNVAVIELNGWDSFRQQGASGGALARNIGSLAGGLSIFADRLGELWEDTAVLVVSAHGRTVEPNASGGTDIGTATSWLLLDGSLSSARTIGIQPKISRDALLEGGGIAPTVDARGFLAAVLKRHWRLSDAVLSKTVFPGQPFTMPVDF